MAPRRSSKKRRTSRSISSKCPKGQISRSGSYVPGFTRRDGTKVKGFYRKDVCIKDLGKKGKGQQLFVLEKGKLGKYGYKDVKKLTTKERHAALDRAVRGISRQPGKNKYDAALSIFRKLNALATLNKNTNPTLAAKFRADRNYVGKAYGVSK